MATGTVGGGYADAQYMANVEYDTQYQTMRVPNITYEEVQVEVKVPRAQTIVEYREVEVVKEVPVIEYRDREVVKEVFKEVADPRVASQIQEKERELISLQRELSSMKLSLQQIREQPAKIEYRERTTTKEVCINNAWKLWRIL
jgi:hypothetical protein